jgi:hypothetical protein
VNWVLALLAFAGVMAMLSTSVSVAVEAVHKLLGLRRAGLEEMLRALHVDVLSKLPAAEDDGDERRRRTEAMAFAKAMTASPSFGGKGRWWWARNIPGINHIYQPRFERLSTLQYIEQLAQTPVGQRLANSDPDKLRGAVHTLAYQFERYGQAQSDYFGRRAKVISAIVALAVVVGGNVNAVAVYSQLAHSPGSLTSTLSLLESRNVETLNADVDAAQQKLARLEERARLFSTSLTPDPGAMAALASDLRQANDELAGLKQQLSETSEEGKGLDALRLPVGPTHFPFCAGGGLLEAPAGLAAAQAAVADGCGGELTGLLGRDFVPASLDAGGASPAFLTRAGAVGGRLLTWEGMGWIFSIIVTTGLVSLGAPFWFDLFRRLGAMVGRDKIASAIDRQRQIEAQAASVRTGVRDASANDLEQLTKALVTSAGRAQAPAPPPGQRYGLSSADATPDQVADPGDGGDVRVAVTGMRQLRG